MSNDTVIPQNANAAEDVESRPRRSPRYSEPRRRKPRVMSSRQEIYDTILWRLNSQKPADTTLAVGLVGCQARVGVTTIAANLAIQAGSELAQRVLLIDANCHSPSLHKIFRVANERGLLDILSGDLSPRECEPKPVDENVDLLPIGNMSDSNGLGLQNQMAAEMLEFFRAEYELVIVDLPSAEKLSKALPLAKVLDSVLLVAQSESTKQHDAQRALRRLEEDGVEITGTLLNRHRNYLPRWLRRWL